MSDCNTPLGPIVIDRHQIAARVAELGTAITKDYEGRNLLLLSVLKGAVIFMADLARAIGLPLEMEYLAISSFQQDRDTDERRNIRITKDVAAPLCDKDVLVVEDIIDTGLTLYYILRFLAAKEPHSLEVCTLLDRPYRRLVDINVRYTGFTAPDTFFVGYGFDYQQRKRNLPDVAELRI